MPGGENATPAPTAEPEREELTLFIGAAAEKNEQGEDKSFYGAVENWDEPFLVSKESLAKITPKVEALQAAEPTPTPAPTVPNPE